MAEIYGTIGIRPMGAYNPDTKYELLNLVDYDGSSYVAHTEPPLGTLPTNTAYWQVTAQGTSKATADSVGTVKPDGKTTEVNADGALGVKKATDTTRGVVMGSRSIRVSEDNASIYVQTDFEQATNLVNLVSGEVLDMMLGKISKAIAVTMGLDQNALLKNMLTNIDANDPNKIPTSAFAHTLYERIGMGTALTAGANLTEAANALNSNLTALSSDLAGIKPVTNRTATYKPDNTDFNDLNQPGWYNVYSNDTNITHAPVNGIGRLLLRVESVNTGDSNWITIQTAIEWFNTGGVTPKTWKRWTYSTNSGFYWTSWTQSI